MTSIAASVPYSEALIKRLLIPERGDAVIDTRGRLGMVDEVSHSLHSDSIMVNVQFGAGGPFDWINADKLLFASLEQIRAAGRVGVGGMRVHGVGEVADLEDV